MLHRPGTGGSASAGNQSAAAISAGFKRISPPAYRAVKATIRVFGKRPRLAAEVTDVSHPQTDFFAYLPADTFLQSFPRFNESSQDAVKTGANPRRAGQKNLVGIKDRDDNCRRHPRVVDEAAGRANLGAFILGVPGHVSAASAELVGPRPVNHLVGPSGNGRHLVVDRTQKLPARSIRHLEIPFPQMPARRCSNRCRSDIRGTAGASSRPR